MLELLCWSYSTSRVVLSCGVLLLMESVIGIFYFHITTAVFSVHVLSECPKGVFGVLVGIGTVLLGCH